MNARGLLLLAFLAPALADCGGIDAREAVGQVCYCVPPAHQAEDCYPVLHPHEDRWTFLLPALGHAVAAPPDPARLRCHLEDS